MHLQLVTPGRDTGTQTEIIKGLAPGQPLITSWTDDVKEGAKVKAVEPAKPGARGAGGLGQ